MHAQVLLFLFSLRELHPELEHQCLHGSCFRLHQLLALVFPGAEPWYDHDHVITLIGGRFYDIRGRGAWAYWVAQRRAPLCFQRSPRQIPGRTGETCQRRNQMTTPRPHAELAARYFADDTLKCWYRENPNMEWKIPWYPSWDANGEYYVGHEPPPPTKRSITLTVNGREWVLPEPSRVKPAYGEAVWILGIKSLPTTWSWYDCEEQNAALAAGQLYATKDDCQAWADFDKWCRGGGV